MKTAFVFLFLIFTTLFPLVSPEMAGQEVSTDSPSLEGPSKVQPLLPRETPGLIYVEGEDAVSTTFNVEATYNYSCSGLKTLQLSRITGLQGDAPFYAEYVIYVEEEGEYEFWYSGTPPGPRDNLYPSYCSPIRLILDEEPPIELYREDVAVVENYTPSFYWIYAGDLSLTQGVHRIRLEVQEKRRYDGRYLFYLDSFFFLSKARRDQVLENPGTAFFPRDPDNRSIDFPLQSLAAYQRLIQEEPDSVNLYFELSLVNSLLGDYMNALKNLSKAYALEPENNQILLLIAKNRIWKGDISEGLYNYRELLNRDPSKASLWAEAGKVAAWTNRYWEAVSFYEDAQKRFPENLNIIVNHALTRLWMSDQRKAEDLMTQAKTLAGDNPDRLLELARLYMQNDYPLFARDLLVTALKELPQSLELYLLLQQAYQQSGSSQEADKVYDLISETFEESPALTRYLNLYKKRQGLRELILQDYKKRIQEDPSNIELRTTLAQSYFWNGMKNEGIEETRGVLMNYLYLDFLSLDQRSFDLLERIDQIYLFLGWLAGVPAETEVLKKGLTEGLSAYRGALKAAEKEAKAENPSFELRGALEEQKKSLLLLLEKIYSFIQHYEELIEEVELAADSLDSLLKEENQDQLAFERGTQVNRWTWDRNFTLRELSEISLREPVLGNYLLGRIHQIEGRYDSARQYFSLALEGEEEAIKYARDQLERWSNTPAASLPSISMDGENPYAPYLQDLLNLRERLVTLVPRSILLPENLEEETATSIARLDQIKKAAPLKQRDLKNREKTLLLVLGKRMVRQFYSWEENTYLLRYTLGDYYLSVGRPEKGVEQFRKVLAVDPENLSALYKLGTVQQLSGDWARAMDTYKKVYQADPNYENTVRYHNQLARSNADSFSSSLQLFYDSSRTQVVGEGIYKRNINSYFGLEALYRWDADQLYSGFSGSTPPSFSVQNLSLGFPFRFSGVTVKPFFAVGLSSSPEPGAEYNLLQIFTEGEAAPGGGLEIGFNKGIYGLKGVLGYERKRDTWFTGRERVDQLYGQASFTSYSYYPRNSILKAFSTRTFARLDSLLDSNLIFSGVEEAVVSFLVSSSPGVMLDLNGTLSYETALNPAAAEYYAPDSVISLKTGVRGTVYVPLRRGGDFRLSCWISPGGYREGRGAESEGFKLNLEGDLQAAYSKGFSYLYLRVYGSSAFTRGAFPATDYWSLLSSVGFSTQLPDLLAP